METFLQERSESLVQGLRYGLEEQASASPITLELELVSTEAEAVQEGWAAVPNTPGADLITAQARSEQWEIEPPRINCTLLTLSSSANQEFDKLLQTSGNMINAKSYLTLQQSLTGSTNRVNFFASKSNIEALFLAFLGPAKCTPQAHASADNGALVTTRINERNQKNV